MLSPFVIGPVEHAQSLQESWFGGAAKDATWNRSTAFVEISIKGAGRSQGAFGRRPETAAYLLDFLLIQVTSTPAGQYSVLIIHVFLLGLLGSVERART